MKILVFIYLLVGYSFLSYSQCAMCGTQITNNANAGDTGLAEGLNTGIIYLFSAPYILIAIVGYLWYRNAKENKK